MFRLKADMQLCLLALAGITVKESHYKYNNKVKKKEQGVGRGRMAFISWLHPNSIKFHT